MPKTFYYEQLHEMEPRPGTNYHTTYYKQTLEQRKRLTNHFKECLQELNDYLDKHPNELNWAQDYPLKGFPKTTGTNRTLMEVLTDIAKEAAGKRPNGMPKDYSKAPIDRWNKLFKDTDYEVALEQTSEEFFEDF